MIDIKNMVRDKQKILSNLVTMSDGSIVTKTGCKIHIPVRFTEHELAYVGAEVYTIGIFPIIMEDTYYSVMLIMGMIQLEPTAIEKIKIDSQDYYEFTFKKGSRVIVSDSPVKTDTLPYKVYDEILSKAKVPYYMDYELLGNIFDTAKKHANADVGTNSEATELIISMVARDPKDRTKYYRQAVQSVLDVHNIKPDWVPIRSVSFSATNTTNKLAGAYFDEGVGAALLYPSERKERIEEILTK